MVYDKNLTIAIQLGGRVAVANLPDVGSLPIQPGDDVEAFIERHIKPLVYHALEELKNAQEGIDGARG